MSITKGVPLKSNSSTFTQLTSRLKNFLRGWLLVLSLKEDLVKCATVCVKSEVILISNLVISLVPDMILKTIVELYKVD